MIFLLVTVIGAPPRCGDISAGESCALMPLIYPRTAQAERNWRSKPTLHRLLRGAKNRAVLNPPTTPLSNSSAGRASVLKLSQPEQLWTATPSLFGLVTTICNSIGALHHRQVTTSLLASGIAAP
jgi:hypothetical protein